MDAISFHIFWTVLTMVAFIALIVWAWSGKQKAAFDKASRIPLEEDKTESVNVQSASNTADKEDQS